MTVSAETIHVLHVDDEPAVADSTARVLEREDDRMTVATATSAHDGLEYLATHNVDCIVSDYEMPGLNGIEFLDAVRKRYPDLPFILYTGKGSEEVASEAISSGVSDYLQKATGTSQYAVLANRITNAVRQYRTEQELSEIQQRYEWISELATDAFWEWDVETDTVHRSEGFQRVFGYDETGDDLQWYIDRVHPDDSDALSNVMTGAIAGGRETFEDEHRFRAADGSYSLVNVSGRIIYEDGEAKRVVGTLTDVTERTEREQLQHIIIDVSSRLIDADEDQIDEQIEEALGQIGTFEEADRCYVFQFHDDGALMDNTHEWCAEGVTPHKPELRNLPTETFSWFFPRIADFETVTVPDREELPPEANHLRTTLASGNIRSIVTIPLTKAGEVVGFIGFDWLNEAEAWSEGTIDLLEVTGNIIANALARKKTIAERNERERELERAKTIIENTTAIIYVKDLDGRYTLVNSRYEEVLGMDREEILGKTDFDFQSEEYARQVRENDLRAVETESPIEVEEEAFRGGEVWTYISVKVPIFDEDGDPTAVCGISTDITERNERERELERKNERLDEFASLVSHDLRNPLNTLELSLELAQRTGEEDHYERCHRAVDRMNTLIDDLLTLAREGEQIDDTEPIGMPEAVKMAWTTVETCGVDLSIETESMIEADRGRLTQLLENLFRNAVEHGSTNPPSQAPRERIERGMTGSCSQASEAADSDSVNVTITVGDLDGGFYVEDDGPGIPESERDEVFESGYSTSDSGTGFGLVIVKRIAEAHGWDVAVTEGVSGGARFEITNVEYPNQ